MADDNAGPSTSDAVPNRENSRFKSEARRITLRYTRLAVAGALFGSITPWMATWHFVLELGTPFIVIYAVLAAGALVILLTLKSWRWSVVASVAAILAGGQTLPCYTGKPVESPAGTPLRVMTVNVFTPNQNYAGLVDLLRRERADLVAILEVNQAWAEALVELEGEYPYRLVEPQEDNFGIGLLSKIPFDDITMIDLEGVFAIRALLEIGNEQITVLAVHTLPPGSPLYASIRNKQLELLPGLMQEGGNPIILLGDLNATRWSPYFTDLLERSGASDARQGYGVLGTWPTPLSPCLIPIDQCLYTPPLHVTDIRRGPRFGSDHLPLTIDFVVPQPNEDLTGRPAT